MRASSSGPHDGEPAREFSSPISVSRRLNAAYRAEVSDLKGDGDQAVIAAVSSSSVSKKPWASAEPKVHSAGPAVLNAVVIFAVSGHTSSAKPTKKMPSHSASWPSRMTAAWQAASPVAQPISLTGRVISRNAHSRPCRPAGSGGCRARGTMTVPITLTAAVQHVAVRRPAAATSRAAIEAIKSNLLPQSDGPAGGCDCDPLRPGWPATAGSEAN